MTSNPPLPPLNYQFLKKIEALESVEQIIMFGSRARGTARTRSDIDLAVRFHPESLVSVEWQAVQDILENADTLLPIDCVNLNTLVSPALLENIQKEGVVLYQKKLTTSFPNLAL